MSIKLYNTLTKEIEEIKTIKQKEVSMYHCGPTVYDYLHIGNMKMYVFADILRRTFEFSGYKVNQVINLTDVGHLVADGDEGEDKIEKAAVANNKTAKEIADFFINIFFEDLNKMNIKSEGTIFPKATDNIPEQIALIKKLELEGHIYKTSDGIYFNVSTFPDYGKLGNIDLEGLQVGKRIDFNTEKRTPYDFALWKFSPSDQKRQQEWSSPWGVGFPGWHIECSAMAQKYLGDTFDIHTGGIDHIPGHHNNEIAQSECANHVPLANIWMHGAFMNWKDKKMSKSDGAFITLADLEKQNIYPLSYRYFLLQARYSQPLFFDLADIQASQTAYYRLKNRIQDILKNNKEITNQENIENKITEIIENDLDTPNLLAYLWELVNIKNINKEIIEKFDSILGLKILEQAIISEEVFKIKAERDIARENKDFTKSDELRKHIQDLGYGVLDTPDGTEIVKK
jgi:cysteinyl-tRNA synthetase